MVSDYEQRILDDVSEHGWFCVSVGAGEGEPAFTYSVGYIDSLKCAEFIVFGLPARLSHSMLWGVFEKIRDGVVVPAEGRRWPNLLEGYNCISRAVHPSQIRREHFNSAIWYWSHTGRSRDSVQAFQLFWPDTQLGLFPWENGCEQEVRDLQPLLYLPREVGLA